MLNRVLDSNNTPTQTFVQDGNTRVAGTVIEGLPLGLVGAEVVLKVGGPSGGIAVTQQGAGHGAVTPIPTTGQTVGTSTVAARATRASCLIQCYSTSPEALWFGYISGVNASTGVQLLAGQSCPIGNTAAIFFFSVGGTATGVVIEDYN